MTKTVNADDKKSQCFDYKYNREDALSERKMQLNSQFQLRTQCFDMNLNFGQTPKDFESLSSDQRWLIFSTTTL